MSDLEQLIRKIVREEIQKAQCGERCPEAIRVEANLTREQLAEKSGISRATICRIERGDTKRIRLHTIRALADALGDPRYAEVALNWRKSDVKVS